MHIYIKHSCMLWWYEKSWTLKRSCLKMSFPRTVVWGHISLVSFLLMWNTLTKQLKIQRVYLVHSSSFSPLSKGKSHWQELDVVIDSASSVKKQRTRGECDLWWEGLPTLINIIKLKPPQTHPNAHLQDVSKICQDNNSHLPVQFHCLATWHPNIHPLSL